MPGRPTALVDVAKVNSLQVTNRWSLEFDKVPPFIDGSNSEALNLYNHSIIDTQVPSGTITSLLHENKGTTSEWFGKFEYGRDLTILMTDNETMDNWCASWLWLYYIRNHNSKAARANRRDLTTDVTLTVYNQVNEPTTQFLFREVWPYNVPEISLSGAPNLMEFSVSFKYLSFEPTRLKNRDISLHAQPGEHQYNAGQVGSN